LEASVQEVGIATEISENSDAWDNVNVLPNPNDENFNIVNNNIYSKAFIIYNIEGKSIKEGVIKQGSNFIDLHTFLHSFSNTP
jgi:hypothetical protein